MDRDVKIEPGKEYEFERCMGTGSKVNVSEDVFEKLDSIIIEIMTLKKELAGKLNRIT